MPCSFVCRQRHTAQTDCVVILKNAIDMHRSKRPQAGGGHNEISPPAGLDNLNIAVHHHVLGVSFSNDLGCPAHMVIVRLAIEQDFYVLPAKAEPLDARSYLWRRRREVGVDENIPLWGDHQVARQILAAYVIEIVGDAERCQRCRPPGIRLRMRRRTETKQYQEYPNKTRAHRVRTG